VSVALQPGEIIHHMQLAKAIFYQDNSLDEAISEFRTVIKMNPEQEEFHHQLALFLVQKGKWQEAIPEVRETIELREKKNQYSNADHIFLGSLLRKQGNRDDAFAEFRTAYLREDGFMEISQRIVNQFMEDCGDVKKYYQFTVIDCTTIPTTKSQSRCWRKDESQVCPTK
jgi:tetratricopeptide (TPR) repeat protein